MPFQDLLLQIDSYPAATPDPAIDAAVAFAQALGSRLTALAVHVDIPLSSNVLADRLINLSGLEQEWEARSLAACRAAVKHFESAARRAGVFAGAEVQEINLYAVDDALARRARTRDLCIVPLADRYDGQIELAQQVIFQSGRPALAFAATRPLFASGAIGAIAVAWDGSRSAARALADALPILRRAASVRIVTFVNEKEAARGGLGDEVVRHLATHGVVAVADEVDAKGVKIGRAIDAYLAKSPADLLVMGAYGHSRMLEFVLGGATEHVLRSPPTAVFLSH
jgi:nucleotide-binding universal stress UspA family protein